MAATTAIEPFSNRHHFTPMMTLSDNNIPKPLRVCFSYAAYAKNLIHSLSSSNTPVEPGLSESEFASVESSYNFTFPPDLRSILREGLPVGPGFPNWRSSSGQQLEILTSLPILGICKEVAKNGFWDGSWGYRPDDGERAARLAKGFLKNEAPILVPIYRRFYIPATPCVAGNPVFYVHGGDVRVWSFDIAGFFQRVEFKMNGDQEVSRRPAGLSGGVTLFTSPAWAATEARRIEFWTEMAESGREKALARLGARGWWSGDLGCCLEEVCWRLMDGGWKEEDIREMMIMDGCDELKRGEDSWGGRVDVECVELRVRAMSDRLLRGGWSTEDVVESLGSLEDFHRSCVVDGDSCFDFRCTKK